MRRIFPILLLFAPILVAQEAAKGPPTLDQIQELLRARERQLQSLVISIETSGTLPNDLSHSAQGRTRVLGKTHRHTTIRGSMGPAMEFENETVTTPEGTWMRQQDRMQGEVFVRMDAALQQKLAEASKVLGRSVPGAEEDPLAMAGSRVLEDFRRWFDLSVAELKQDGKDYWLLRGPARAREDNTEPAPELGDSAEIRIDPHTHTLVEFVLFEQGKPKDRMRITELELDAKLDPASFRIELPPGKAWIDAMNHPPLKAMIDDILADAKEAQQSQQTQPKDEEARKK